MEEGSVYFELRVWGFLEEKGEKKVGGEVKEGRDR